MYIVFIAWLFVVLMMAITEKSVVAGVLTFVLFGLAPCALLFWLFGHSLRRKARNGSQSMRQEEVNQPDGEHPQRNERDLL